MPKSSKAKKKSRIYIHTYKLANTYVKLAQSITLHKAFFTQFRYSLEILLSIYIIKERPTILRKFLKLSNARILQER